MPFLGKFDAVVAVDAHESGKYGVDGFKVKKGSLSVFDVCNEASVEVFGNHREKCLARSRERIKVGTNCKTRFSSEDDMRCFRVHKPENFQKSKEEKD